MPMPVILCAVNFNDNALNMLRYVFKLNKTLRARILILHVYESPLMYTTANFAIDKDLELFTEAKRHLDQMIRTLHDEKASRGMDVSVRIEQGVPAERVLRIAEKENISLVAMAASTLSQVERLIVGSNATRVLRKAKCMVLIVPATAKFRGLKTMLFATDMKPDNLAAGKRLARFTRLFNTNISVVHIDRRKAGTAENGTVARKPAARNDNMVTIHARSVSEGLGGYLSEHPAHCLAVFHRTRSIFGAVTSTSISKYVSFYCNTPVLVLHAGDRRL